MQNKKISQAKLIVAIFSTVYEDADLVCDSPQASAYVNGHKNIPSGVINGLVNNSQKAVADKIRRTVIPLLDENKKSNIAHSLLDIIANDNNINNDSVMLPEQSMTKLDLIKTDTIVFDYFITGVFFYVGLQIENVGTQSFTKEITLQFVDSCPRSGSAKSIVLSTDSTQNKQEAYRNRNLDSFSQASKRFCILNENELHLLPIAEIISDVNPLHKFHRQFYTDFLLLSPQEQKDVLCLNKLKPFSFPTAPWIDSAIECLKKEIKQYRLSNNNYLYEGAKYFHKAGERHSDFCIDQIDQYVFKFKLAHGIFGSKATLINVIDQYIYDLEHNPDEHNIPPFDLVWNELGLASSTEEITVFWINSLIIHTCLVLHGKNPLEESEEGWKCKDCVDMHKLKTLEDVYYYALLQLYLSYVDK